MTTIDTLEVAKELKAAGFDQAQAEAVARLVRRSQDLDLSALATKADLSELRAATKGDLSDTKADLTTEINRLELKIESTKTDILRWMVVTQIALGGFIFAAIKLAH
jgi:hypothetical protein